MNKSYILLKYLNLPKRDINNVMSSILNQQMNPSTHQTSIHRILIRQPCPQKNHLMELAVFSSVCEGVKSVIDSHQFGSAMRIGIAFNSDQGLGFIRFP